MRKLNRFDSSLKGFKFAGSSKTWDRTGKLVPLDNWYEQGDITVQVSRSGWAAFIEGESATADRLEAAGIAHPRQHGKDEAGLKAALAHLRKLASLRKVAGVSR